MAEFPPNAKVVFEGVFFRVVQWEQKMYDGSTEIFERVWRPSTTTVIAEQDGKIIMNRQSHPHRPESFLSCFGGVIEEGEDPLGGAKRELLEESGLASDDWVSLGELPFGGRMEWITYFYIARNCRKVAEQNLDAGEKIELLSVSPEEFLTKTIYLPDFRERSLRQLLCDSSSEAMRESFMEKLRGKK